MIKHYVEYLTFGLFVADTSEAEVARRSFKNVKTDRCAAYRFFDREISVRKSGEVLTGEKKNFGGWVYINATIIKREDATGMLRSTIDCNGWERAVKTRYGNVYPMEDDATIKNIREVKKA